MLNLIWHCPAGSISFAEFVEIMTLGRADEQEIADDHSRIKTGRAPGRAPNAFNISLMASAYRWGTVFLQRVGWPPGRSPHALSISLMGSALR